MNTKRPFSVFSLCLLALLGGFASQADVITDWNQTAIRVIKASNGSPLPASRALAMMHVAQFDAVNGLEGRYHFFATNYSLPGASLEAAAAQAAFGVLTNLFPATLADLEAALSTSLAAVSDDAARADGVLVGNAASAAVLRLRTQDGASQVLSYTPGTNPGDWQPTPPAFASALSPQWRFVQPWTMTSPSQFRPAPPPTLDSVVYTKDFLEMKAFGDTNSLVRTAEQTAIGLFHIEVPTFTLQTAARNALTKSSRSLVETARLFALLNMALADAYISVWDAKFEYGFWRPVTAIRAADTDGNPSTDADPNWTPLRPTPAHPEYPAAHTITAAAGVAVLISVFGDDLPVTIESPSLPGAPRTFPHFSDFPSESSDARVWAGFHWRNSTLVADDMGRRIGAQVLQNALVNQMPPVITQQPKDQLILAGTPATFSVVAEGYGPLTYQWRSYNPLGTSFTNIPFATNATLILESPQPTTRTFGVVVTDSSALSVTSAPLAKLTVVVPPSFKNPIYDQLGFVGDTVSWTVSAAGSTPLKFQWWWNGAPLAGATRSTLGFSSVTSSNAGNYFLVVSNLYGAATSQVVRLVATAPNPLVAWNDALLPIVESSSLGGMQSVRVIVLMHLAQFEAINAIHKRYTSYFLDLSAPNASAEAAASQAAFTVLTNLMSSDTPTWRALLTKSLSKISDGSAKADGIALGTAVGNAVLVMRDADGTLLNLPEPKIALKPGVWRPTPPNFEPGSSANFAYVTPFTAKSAAQFRLPPPPSLKSAEYATAYNEIKDLGSAGPSTRTELQSDIARYHWYESPPYIAARSVRGLIAQHPLDLVDASRLYALLFMVCMDHYILAWDSKYFYYTWRPITAIRLGDTDGNDATTADPNWNSFLETFTIPDYPSGHATGVSACDEILMSVFGNDASFTITSPSLPDNFRHYEHLSDLTQEAQDSRVYEGIHFRFAVTAGAQLGKQIAQNALRNVLIPLVPDLALNPASNPGSVQLSLFGPGPLSYVIETSNDLLSWNPWQTNAFGLVQIQDETGGNGVHRFYRAVAK